LIRRYRSASIYSDCRSNVTIRCLRIGILLESRENERRFDTARTDAIELYARVRVIQRQRFGHSHDGEFARGVRLRFDKPSCFLS